ncbi:MAG: hypothetical protein IAF58_15495, partial [Leptolyngbya sp.]|nr:hypothetical protein [Candidatus Melainabacteria bacterium]
MFRRILPIIASAIIASAISATSVTVNASDVSAVSSQTVPGQYNVETGAQTLSGWKDTKLKQNILDFVKRVTDRSGKDFVPVEDRIAVFDNDGTLLCEKPAYFQVIFARDSAVSR